MRSAIIPGDRRPNAEQSELRSMFPRHMPFPRYSARSGARGQPSEAYPSWEWSECARGPLLADCRANGRVAVIAVDDEAFRTTGSHRELGRSKCAAAEPRKDLAGHTSAPYRRRVIDCAPPKPFWAGVFGQIGRLSRVPPENCAESTWGVKTWTSNRAVEQTRMSSGPNRS